MCGIAGLVFLKGYERSDSIMAQLRYFFDELMIETQDRGEHATGLVSFRRDGSYDFHKAKGNAVAMATSDAAYRQIIDAFSSDNTSVVIGHTRYLTKGTADNNDNNHPFDIGSVVGVHNGKVENDDVIFKLYDNDFKRIGFVDSELVYQLMNHYSKEHTNLTHEIVKRVLEDGHGEQGVKIRALAALAFAHKGTPTMMHLVKGPERPLEIAFWEEAGVVVINSVTKYINQAADSVKRGFRAILGVEPTITFKHVELKIHNYMSIDANATTFEESMSEQLPVKITSAATTTYNNTGNSYYNRGTGGCGTGTSGTNCSTGVQTSISGRVIEGMLDEASGEITIFTLEQLVGASSATGDKEVQCAECDGVMSDNEKNSAWNNGAADEHKVCEKCYEEMLTGKFNPEGASVK